MMLPADGTSPEPGDANQHHAGHVTRLLASFSHWTGRSLLPAGLAPADAARALYHAPFVVLSHDTAADPRFNYANLTAQRLFEMPWREIVGLPSRFSAEPLAREERERLLARVSRFGYIDDYRGVRVSRTGKRFQVNDAVVWNVLDDAGRHAGQAATFSDWQVL